MRALFDLDWTNPAHVHPVHPRLVDFKFHFQREAQGESDASSPALSSSPNEEQSTLISSFDPIDLLNPSLKLSPHPLHLIPQYCHLPLVLDENGMRLAKRAKSKSLRALREEDKLRPEEIWEKMLQKKNISTL